MTILYFVGRVILYVAIGITMLVGAVIMAVFRGMR